MKHNLLKILIPVFFMAVFFSLPQTIAGAVSFEDFPDSAGHWAETALKSAVTDGLLNGYDDGYLHPDDPISCPQALAIICRVLKPQLPEEFEISENASWYDEYAAKAEQLGVDFRSESLTEGSMTRGEAFYLLADAFQIISAQPDYDILDAFSDSGYLSGKTRDAFASLISGGYVEGYGGKLKPEGTVSRSEFVTVLYRIADKTFSGSSIAKPFNGAIVSGNSTIINTTFSSPVWFSSEATSASLINVTSKLTVFRSNQTDLSILGWCDLERLVIAGGKTSPINVSVNYTSKVDTLVIGDTPHKEVIVSGPVSRIEITGDDLRIDLRANVSEMVVSGKNCTVTGYGSASTIILKTGTCTYDIRHDTIIDDIGFNDTVISLLSPKMLPAGETLSVAASVSSPLPRECVAVWSIDGAVIAETPVSLSEEAVSLSCSHDLTYTRDMPEISDISLTLTYTAPDGQVYNSVTSASIAVENYPAEYYDMPPEKVLELVTHEYAGDYTLEWAEENDYSPYVKETWINTKGYSSKTQYLAWINLTYQRVNIFEGSAGNWKLIKTFMCCSGAKRSPTPVGVYTVFARSARGWTTKDYNCRPVVNFKIGSGYAFHSRLYDPTHSYFYDDTIGYPASHGCIRMYDEDVQWIYDNIPDKTTVVVH